MNETPSAARGTDGRNCSWEQSSLGSGSGTAALVSAITGQGWRRVRPPSKGSVSETEKTSEVEAPSEVTQGARSTWSGQS